MNNTTLTPQKRFCLWMAQGIVDTSFSATVPTTHLLAIGEGRTAQFLFKSVIVEGGRGMVYFRS